MIALPSIRCSWVFSLVILFSVLYGCATPNRPLTKASQLEPQKGTGVLVSGFNFHIPDRRLEKYKFYCKNLVSGENVVCFKGYNNTPKDAVGAHRVTSGAYWLPVGRYELKEIGLSTRIGTRISRGKRTPIYDNQKFSLNRQLQFKINEGVNYLGRFELFFKYNAFYKLSLSKLFVSNARTQDSDMLPGEVRGKIGKEVKTSMPLLEDVKLTFSVPEKLGEWNSVDYKKDECVLMKLGIPLILIPGLEPKAHELMYVSDGILNVKNGSNGFPVFPSTLFSRRIICTLGKYLSENKYAEFRQTGKYTVQKNPKLFEKKLGIIKWKYHYKFPVEFR